MWGLTATGIQNVALLPFLASDHLRATATYSYDTWSAPEFIPCHREWSWWVLCQFQLSNLSWKIENKSHQTLWCQRRKWIKDEKTWYHSFQGHCIFLELPSLRVSHMQPLRSKTTIPNSHPQPPVQNFLVAIINWFWQTVPTKSTEDCILCNTSQIQIIPTSGTHQQSSQIAH